MRNIWLLVAAVSVGCSPVTAEMIEHLSKSDRSWCITITTIYGTAKLGGTGLRQGKMGCTGEGWTVDSAMGSTGAGMGMGQSGLYVIPDGTVVLPPPQPVPRILQQNPPTYREIPVQP